MLVVEDTSRHVAYMERDLGDLAADLGLHLEYERVELDVVTLERELKPAMPPPMTTTW